mmetsp:Transcript_12778/g.19158  ORF Transcript_12778/g.19158 Transcript_12778/m.19158 type:complete len:340 (-) Transcript_12778:77-1096(-)
MIESLSPMWQGLLGTLFTWAVTAAGAGMVFVTDTCGGDQRKQQFLDASLGFAAGVMLAASYWSLLAPAIEMSEEQGSWAFLPASIGFVLGALLVYAGEVFLHSMGAKPDDIDAIQRAAGGFSSSGTFAVNDQEPVEFDVTSTLKTDKKKKLRRRGGHREKLEEGGVPGDKDPDVERRRREKADRISQWRSMILLVAAITIHNFPEGLAVGVGFGAVGKTSGATFAKARNLAIGIGLQNFPEGLAVSMPLRRIGFSRGKAFWWGQMSGMVEPVGGLLGSAAVSLVEPLLPYALSLAAGAMIYVVVDDLVPDAHVSGNPKLATWGCVIGFVVMMSLDVALG